MADGRVQGLRLAQARGEPMASVSRAVALPGLGLRGCRHATKKPGGKRQLLLLDEASLRELRLAPGELKENVLLTGVALEQLPPGQRLRLGERVVVELTGPCVPCFKLDRLRAGLLSEAWGKRGQLAQVLEGGELRVGDEVSLLDVNPNAPRQVTPRLP